MHRALSLRSCDLLITREPLQALGECQEVGGGGHRALGRDGLQGERISFFFVTGYSSCVGISVLLTLWSHRASTPDTCLAAILVYNGRS